MNNTNSLTYRLFRCGPVSCLLLVCLTLTGCSPRYEEAYLLMFPPSAVVIVPKLYAEKTIGDLTKDSTPEPQTDEPANQSSMDKEGDNR